MVNTPLKDSKVDRGKDRELEEQAENAQKDEGGWGWMDKGKQNRGRETHSCGR